MTNLKQLATDLLEKAGKATPEKVNTITKGVVNAAGKQIWHMSGHPGFEPQAKRDVEYYAAASPDVIAALAQAYLEAVEVASAVTSSQALQEASFYTYSEAVEKARAFLEKHFPAPK